MRFHLGCLLVIALAVTACAKRVPLATEDTSESDGLQWDDLPPDTYTSTPTPTPAPPPAVGANDYPRRVFTAAIGRAPSTVEHTNVTAQINALGAVANAQLLVVSAEGFGRLVDSLYRRFLGRAAEQAARDYYTRLVQGGATTVAGIILDLVCAPEFEQYILRLQPGTPSPFVTGLYLLFTGRLPIASELSYWNGLLQSGVSKREIALVFVKLVPFLADWAARGYRDILGREASPAEANAHGQVMLQSFDAVDVLLWKLIELLTCPEFQNKAH